MMIALKKTAKWGGHSLKLSSKKSLLWWKE